MIHWIYLLVAAAVLLVFLLYGEWKRNNKARLYLRLTVSVGAVTSLVCMAYPYAQKNETNSSKKIIILSESFVKDSVDLFLAQQKSKMPVFSPEPVAANSLTGSTVQFINSWTDFVRAHREDTLHLFGNGLSKAILEQLDNHALVFHANATPPAVTHVYWKQQLQPGEPLLVQGHYKNNSGKKIKLALQGFGAIKDSVTVGAHADSDFVLHTVPPHSGKAVYAIVITDGRDTMQKEPVPVDVQAVIPLQLLLLSSSPDFENTFLKNQLSQPGYRFSVINTVSKGKISRQFMNMPAQQQERLSTGLLKKVDVLLADETALQKLSPSELVALRTAIQDEGMGLVIKIDSQKLPTAFYNVFFPVSKIESKQIAQWLHSLAADSDRFAIKMADPLDIVHTNGTQSLLQDAQSHTYAAAVAYGNGKIIATTLQNTYSVALAGNATGYRWLWSLLLNKAAKKVYPASSWENGLMPHLNEPVVMQAEQNDTAATFAIAEQVKIYLQQHSHLLFQWQGMYWPVVSGWQPLPQLGSATGSWYVYNTNDWKQITDYSKMAATKSYAAAHAVVAGDSMDRTNHFYVNWPLFMFVMFISCCFFLWVEQKSG